MAEMEEPQKEAPEAEDSSRPPEQPKVVIDLDEHEADADDKQADTPASRKTARQQGRDYRRKLEEADRRMAELQAQVARLEGRLSAPTPPAPAPAQQQGPDPLQAEIDSIESQQQSIVAAIQAPGQTQEQVQTLMNTWRRMETHRRRLEYRQFREAEKGSEPPDDTENRYIGTAMAAEFPQIMKSDAMKLRARAEALELMETRRAPWSIEIAREACQRVMSKMGLGQRPPAPTDTERSRLSGVPSRAGASGGGGNGQYTPNAFEMKLAQGFTKHIPDLTDEERWVRWAKATGNYKRQAG